MRLNTERLGEAIALHHDGEYRKFSKAIRMDHTTVFKILRGDTKPGTKFFNHFLKYCSARGYDFNYFIIMDGD